MVSMEKNIAELCATHEIGWWREHHVKDYEKVKEHMTKLYVLLFGLNEKKAEELVDLRIKAARMHDIAEKYEDEGKKEKAEEYWKKAKEFLVEHFKGL